MRVADIISIFERYAPVAYQESYDNSGLQVGDPQARVTGALLTLDITEDVLREAIANNCNLIIAHHPLIFSGLKKLTGSNYVQRIVQQAIKHDINLFAVHTNLDNMYHGVNARIAQRLGLTHTRVLAPATGQLLKLYTYVPASHAAQLLQGLFDAGAGTIGHYSECSFSSTGTGTFRGDASTQPFTGTPGGNTENATEEKVEVLVPLHLRQKVLAALRQHHPYEEIAYELIALENTHPEIGAGLIGRLAEPVEEQIFLSLLKNNMKADCIRHTALSNKPVSTVAVCGGSGSFLLPEAIRAGADIFITADFKYHQFFDADGKIVIADIGHYETEQFTPEIFDTILKENNINFAVLLSTLVTNPIKYLY